MYTPMHRYIHVYVHVHIHVFICMYVCVYVYVYRSSYIQVCIYGPLFCFLQPSMVHFFVFYNHDDDTSKRVINLSNYNKWISRGSSLYYRDLGTHGGEKGMRETRVEWMEFTWLLITYVRVFFDLNTSWQPPSLPTP